MTKEERIHAEKIRLAALFVDLDREKFYTLLGLINEAAFLRITLEDLQKEVTPTDSYKNGANQSGQKISATLQAYSKVVVVYQKLIKDLLDAVPTTRKYRAPGADENEYIAYRNFRDNQDIEYYLSDEFTEKLEADRKTALELMAAGQ